MMFKCEECGEKTNSAKSNYWFAKEGEKKMCLDCIRETRQEQNDT